VDVTSSLYKGHRYPMEIISHCVWLYHRFPLSLREIEEMMMARGVLVTYETIHQMVPQVRSSLRESVASPPAPTRACQNFRVSHG
jgi:transposase-like protein